MKTERSSLRSLHSPGAFPRETHATMQLEIYEAIGVYLESLKTHGEPVPPSVDEEVVEVDA